MGKHFLKILAIFIGMIVLALIGIFFVSYFGSGINKNASATPVAK